MNLSEETSPQSTDKKLVELRETKCTCSACGNIWYYGKEEVQKNKAAKMHQVGKAMMCCGGCFPALLIPKQEFALADFSVRTNRINGLARKTSSKEIGT